MAGEKDIIDAAMANDDFDYGDKTVDTNNQETDDGGDDQQQQQPVERGEVQQQSPQQSIQEQSVPGRVPSVKPGDQQQSLAQTSNFKRVGAQFADGKGNIVDKDGKIIARAGESARHWQEASRATAQVNNLTRQMTVMQQERERDKQVLQQAREIAELPTKMGITREEYNEGITLISNWKKNPVETAREIVARTLTLGYNVTDILGKNAGDALEMKAVSQLVKQATAPLEQQQQAAARQAQANTQAETAYNQFIAQFPDAELHAEPIANLMGKGRSAERAYFEVKMFALEHGLDFTQPLGPQVVAMQQRQNGQRPTDQQRAPMANGNGRGSERQMTSEPAMADANSDWGSILSDVMKATT